jgi:hypothetical protein
LFFLIISKKFLTSKLKTVLPNSTNHTEKKVRARRPHQVQRHEKIKPNILGSRVKTFPYMSAALARIADKPYQYFSPRHVHR